MASGKAPTGNATLGGVPFNIKSNASGNQAWAAGTAANYGAGQESVTVNVNVFGVTNVYTLINNSVGQNRPLGCCSTFTGSGERHLYPKNLIGGSDIRAYSDGSKLCHHDKRNDDDYRVQRRVRMFVGYSRLLDMQQISLPAAFATQTLTTVKLVDTGHTWPSTHDLGRHLRRRAGGIGNLNAGSSKTLSVSAYTVQDGNGGADYVVTTVTNTTGVITAAPLTITAVTNTKTYDGTTTATAMPTVTGLRGADSVTGQTEAYNDANVGSSKTLSVSAYTVNDGNGG